MANHQFSGVHERYSRTAPTARLQIYTQCQHGPRHEFDEAVVADQLGKLTSQVAADMGKIKMFEATVARLMKQHNDSHDLGKIHAARTPPHATG